MGAEDAIRLIFGTGLFFVSGYAALRLFAGNMEAGPATRAALSFMLGLGVISLEMFFMALAAIPFSVPLIALPWLLAAVYLRFFRRKERPRPLTKPFSSRGAAVLWGASLLVVAAQVIYSFAYAPLLPITGWDAWQTWFFKALAFYRDGTVKTSLFSDPLVHPDYPLLVPLSATWLYLCLGYAGENLARLIYPLQFASLLAVFYHIIARLTTRVNAAVFTAMLSLAPILLVHGAGFPVRVGPLYSGDFVGYADITLSFYLLASAAFLYIYALDGERGHGALAALFMGMGAWTKDEGILFAITGGVILAAHMIANKKPLKELLLFLGIIIAFAGPWEFYKASLGIPSQYETSPAVAFERLGNIPVILKSFTKFMARTDLYNLTWYVWALTTVVNIKNLFRRPLVYLNLMLVLQFAGYSFVYLITHLDLRFHIGTSADRVILHLVPLALLVASLNVAQLLAIGVKTPQKDA